MTDKPESLTTPELWENISRMIELKKKAIKLLEEMGEALVVQRHKKCKLLGVENPRDTATTAHELAGRSSMGWSVGSVYALFRAYQKAVGDGRSSFVYPDRPDGVEYDIHYAYYLLRVLKRNFHFDWRLRDLGMAPPPVINKEEKPT